MIKEALRLTPYANHPPCTLFLQCDRVIRKGNQTNKVMSQLIYGNHIKRRIGNIKDISKG